MKPGYERVYALIHLDRIRENVKSIMAGVPAGTKSLAVIKADGYGHGALEAAKAVKDLVWGFAVATPDEGIHLRKHGIRNPILLLGFAPERRYADMVDYEIRIPVYEIKQAEVLNREAQELGKKAFAHVKVDTGMSRIGLTPDEKGLEIVRQMADCPNVCLEGIFTHLANADIPDPGPADRQLAVFMNFIERLEQEGIRFPIRHAANSAASILRHGAGLDMCRLGISMYGLLPSTEVDFSEAPVKPAMELFSEVTYVKTVPAGTPVSYGSTYVTNHETRIATISVGYADGYARSLSNKGNVLIRGMRAPIIGRICMDQMMADVTDIPGIQEQDQVVLVGSDGGECITFEELGELSGRFNYEFVCGISKRVPRIYMNGDETVGMNDYFDI